MSTTLPPESENVIEKSTGEANSTEKYTGTDESITFESFISHGINVSRTYLRNDDLAGFLGTAAGQYTVLQTKPLNGPSALEDICTCLTEELRRFMTPYKGMSLCVCGIGNADLRTDSLGPEVAKRIYPKLPMKSDFENIMVFCPGVSGNTGIKISTAISGIAAAAKADCILTIDSTCCSDYEKLCSSIHLTDAGIQIYGGAEQLNLSSIGKPIISIGVPTIIRVSQLNPNAKALSEGFLTVSNIENVIRRAALVIACAILQVLYPDLNYPSSMQIAEGMVL